MSDLITIPKWGRFQHYKKQTRPAWTKSYTQLLHDPNYMKLSGHQRAVLHGLWLLYASSGRQVVADTASLSSQLQLRVSSQQLEALNHAGFIRFRSRVGLEKVYAREEKSKSNPKAVKEHHSVANGNGPGLEISEAMLRSAK